MKTFKNKLRKQEEESEKEKEDNFKLIKSENISKGSELLTRKNSTVNEVKDDKELNFLINFHYEETVKSNPFYQNPKSETLTNLIQPVQQIPHIDEIKKAKNKYTIRYNPIPSKKKFKFYVGTGNNEEIVKVVLGSRKCWEETAECTPVFMQTTRSST